MQHARNNLYRPYKGDEHLVVQFFMDEEKNEIKTAEAGYAVYDEVEKVKVRMPGEKLIDVEAFATSQCLVYDGNVAETVTYADRFPEDYERFKKGLGAAMSGLPLKHAPFLSKAEVSMMEAQNLYTVEQLSEMSGAPLRTLGPRGREWQQKALAFLKTAAGSRDALADAAAMSDMQRQIDTLQAQLQVALGAPAADAAPVVDDESSRKSEIKDQIEALTGVRPRGNPSIANLEGMLAEAQA